MAGNDTKSPVESGVLFELKELMRDEDKRIEAEEAQRRGRSLATASKTFAGSTGVARASKKQGLFVCYRREDSRATTGRVVDWLVREFGTDSVFYDLDSIPLGVDFRLHIEQYMQRCAVFLAIVGPKWLDWSKQGQRSLDDPNDYVRCEILSAIQHDLAVIPVLTDDAKMPEKSRLPDALRSFADRNGITLEHDPNFHSGMQRLIAGVKQAIGAAQLDSEAPVNLVAEPQSLAREERREPERDSLRGTVFLSYASEDLAIVLRIRAELERNGIECWLDRKQLQSSDDWREIEQNIRTCGLFVPIISSSTLVRADRSFRRELHVALAYSQQLRADQTFILPVVIDDTNPGEAAIDHRLREFYWQRLPKGEVTPEFIHTVVLAIRRNRR